MIRLGGFNLGGEGHKPKTPEQLLTEADAFVLQGDYAAAIGRFREFAQHKKTDPKQAAEIFLTLWRAIESHAIRSLGATKAESAADLDAEGELVFGSFARFNAVGTDFNLHSMVLPEEAALIATPENLKKLQERLMPPDPRKKADTK